MADTKLTALTAITALTTDDLMYAVDDPTGTPASKKITWANVMASLTKVGVVTVTQPATGSTLTIPDGVTFTGPSASGTAATLAGTETLTNKRVSKRVVDLADATSFTLSADTADVNTHTNTQATGTLTANAPSGTPTNGQEIIFRIKSTNVQTYSWNAAFRGGTTALPVASTGGGKTDYYKFIYNSADSKWDYFSMGVNF